MAGYEQEVRYKGSFGPGVLACATRGGRRREAGHCFHLLFSSFSFYAVCFSPTSGILRKLIFFSSPHILAYTRRNIKKITWVLEGEDFFLYFIFQLIGENFGGVYVYHWAKN